MRIINDVPHVEIFLKNAKADVVQLRIPHCGLSCPLGDFRVLYKSILPTKSFEEECMVKESKRSSADKHGKYLEMHKL